MMNNSSIVVRDWSRPKKTGTDRDGTGTEPGSVFRSPVGRFRAGTSRSTDWFRGSDLTYTWPIWR